jgi:DNA-binding MarR family transcriptional regulator
MKTKADFAKKYFPSVLQDGSRSSALLRFIMTRLSRGDMQLISVFSVGNKQGFTQSETKKALDVLEVREAITFYVRPTNDSETISVHLTQLGREIFKVVRDEA